MKLKFFFLCILVFFNIKCWGDDINNIYFDKIEKNPAYAGDSLNWDLNYNYSWSGYYGSISKLSFDKYFSSINSGLGFHCYYNFLYKSFDFAFSRRVIFNSFRIDFGSLVGVSSSGFLKYNLKRFNYDEYVYKTRLNLSFGSIIYYKNQNIGFSYNADFFSPYKTNIYNPYGNTDTIINFYNKSRLNLNYKVNLKLTDNLLLIPELIDIYDFNFSDNYFLIGAQIKIKNQFGFGLISESLNNISVFSSFRILKKAEILIYSTGILTFTSRSNQVYSNEINSRSYGITLNLKL